MLSSCASYQYLLYRGESKLLMTCKQVFTHVAISHGQMFLGQGQAACRAENRTYNVIKYLVSAIHDEEA